MPTLSCDRCTAPVVLFRDARVGLAPLAITCPRCAHPAWRPTARPM